MRLWRRWKRLNACSLAFKSRPNDLTSDSVGTPELSCNTLDN